MINVTIFFNEGQGTLRPNPANIARIITPHQDAEVDELSMGEPQPLQHLKIEGEGGFECSNFGVENHGRSQRPRYCECHFNGFTWRRGTQTSYRSRPSFMTDNSMYDGSLDNI